MRQRKKVQDRERKSARRNHYPDEKGNNPTVTSISSNTCLVGYVVGKNPARTLSLTA